MVNISFHCHAYAACKSLEYAFYLVVFVGTFCLDVKVYPRRIANAFEEMVEHFCRHLSDFLALKLCIPYQSRPASKVKAYLCEAVIHGKGVSVTFYSALIAKRFCYALTENDACILYGMVFIHIKITVASDI